MANFEALIRGALAAKGARTPEERAIVYQSSRNALARLIEGNRSMTVESAVVQQKTLEDAILRIEAEFTAPPPLPEETTVIPTPQPVEEFTPSPVIEDAPASLPEIPSEETSLAEAVQPQIEPAEIVEAPQPETDPFLETQQVLGVTPDARPAPEPQETSVAEEAAPQQELPSAPEAVVETAPQLEDEYRAEPVEDDYYGGPEVYADEPTTLPTGFAKRRRAQRNWFWFVMILIIVGLLAWIGYRAFLGVMDGSLLGLSDSAVQTGPKEDEESSYFTIVEPGDLTALVVSDRGRVEIVNEQGLEMIRILSVRNQADRAEAAKPILLRLKPGVIKEIRGKRVTAEIFARSGKSGPAQFAIECLFGSQIGCGRKRFRVGVQPEASIFAFTMEGNRDIDSDAFIAISTDITDNASITGEGDILDIVYVRLRTSKNR